MNWGAGWENGCVGIGVKERGEGGECGMHGKPRQGDEARHVATGGGNGHVRIASDQRPRNDAEKIADIARCSAGAVWREETCSVSKTGGL